MVQISAAKKKASLAVKLRPYLRCWRLYLMILPALVFIILFAYKPMYGILIAFKDYDMRKGILGSDWCGFFHFSRLLRSYWFPLILRNTLTISVLSLLVGFPFPILLALMLNELSHTRIRNTIQTVSYAPHFISTVVICGMITLFLNPSSGIVNKFITLFGAQPIAFMQNEGMFKWIYVISGVWQGAGWGSIIYFAALSGVDKSLLEAAEIDGASRLQKIYYINLPVLIPTVLVLFILNCGSLLSVGYEKVYLLQNSVNMTSAEVISTYVYKVGLEQTDFSFSTAAGLFNSVVNSIILILANTISRKVSKVGLW